jgi:hypothetical protein
MIPVRVNLPALFAGNLTRLRIMAGVTRQRHGISDPPRFRDHLAGLREHHGVAGAGRPDAGGNVRALPGKAGSCHLRRPRAAAIRGAPRAAAIRGAPRAAAIRGGYAPWFDAWLARL